MTDDKAVAQARFDDKLKVYWFLQVVLVMLATVVGVLAIPVWLLGWGQWYTRRAFEALQCVLTARSLIVRRGILFKVEKTIPLDKIQDLSLREGPPLKAFGLMSVKVETAGQSAGQGSSEANLVGIIDARKFRDQVLHQRDRVTNMMTDQVGDHEIAPDEGVQLLREIRDAVVKMAQSSER